MKGCGEFARTQSYDHLASKSENSDTANVNLIAGKRGEQSLAMLQIAGSNQEMLHDAATVSSTTRLNAGCPATASAHFAKGTLATGGTRESGFNVRKLGDNHRAQQEANARNKIRALASVKGAQLDRVNALEVAHNQRSTASCLH